jgi:hypothetical protein
MFFSIGGNYTVPLPIHPKYEIDNLYAMKFTLSYLGMVPERLDGLVWEEEFADYEDEHIEHRQNGKEYEP